MLSTNEILQFIAADKMSAKKHEARVGQRYYEGEHDIKKYKLYYFNADGDLVEDSNRSNIKISHTFFTELVDQVTQYVLSGDGFVKSDIPELQNKLDEYFNENEDFTAELYDVISGAKSKGFEYMYAYKNENGKTAFQCADSLGVVEVRKKDTDDGCAYVIYHYVDRVEKGTKDITRIEVWGETDVWYYVMDDKGGLVLDDSEPINPRPHILKVDDRGDRYDGGGYGVIPFFRLDNCKKQSSDLKAVKPLIDDYDLMSCGLSNNIQDASEYVVVVKSYQGDNMDELVQNIKIKKHIGVDGSEGGDVDFKTVDIPYQARQAKLELDEKNIYRFGFGLNTAGLKDTSATTNIAIKTAYALLDMKAKKLEIRLKQFMRKILKLVLKEINENDGADYQMKDVYFEFTHEVMSNALENAQIKQTQAQTRATEINALLSVAEMLDDETVLQIICELLDIDYEKVKAKLPQSPDDSLENAQMLLDDISTEEDDEMDSRGITGSENGISEDEEASQNEVLALLQSIIDELG